MAQLMMTWLVIEAEAATNTELTDIVLCVCVCAVLFCRCHRLKIDWVWTYVFVCRYDIINDKEKTKEKM